MFSRIMERLGYKPKQQVQNLKDMLEYTLSRHAKDAGIKQEIQLAQLSKIHRRLSKHEPVIDYVFECMSAIRKKELEDG